MADLNVSISEPSGINEDYGYNLVKNADFETVPGTITAPTNTANRWIDGTAAGNSSPTGLGWGIVSLASSAQAGYDSTVSNSGTYSLKLSTLNTSGTVVVGTYAVSPQTYLLIPIYPSTKYTLTAFVKTNNVVTNSAFVDFREYSSSLSVLATTSSNKLSGTNAFTKLTATIPSTQATSAYATVFLRNNIAGNVSDAWFDDIVLSYTPPGGQVAITSGVVVGAGIQNIIGPKIWS